MNMDSSQFRRLFSTHFTFKPSKSGLSKSFCRKHNTKFDLKNLNIYISFGMWRQNRLNQHPNYYASVCNVNYHTKYLWRSQHSANFFFCWANINAIAAASVNISNRRFSCHTNGSIKLRGLAESKHGKWFKSNKMHWYSNTINIKCQIYSSHCCEASFETCEVPQSAFIFIRSVFCNFCFQCLPTAHRADTHSSVNTHAWSHANEYFMVHWLSNACVCTKQFWITDKICLNKTDDGITSGEIWYLDGSFIMNNKCDLHS